MDCNLQSITEISDLEIEVNANVMFAIWLKCLYHWLVFIRSSAVGNDPL